MAIASIELGRVAQKGNGSTIHGDCIAQEQEAIGAEVTTALAVTQAHQVAGAEVWRVTTDDTACYVAVGGTPDADALVETDNTSARRLVPAGGTIEMPAPLGSKVCVKAVA